MRSDQVSGVDANDLARNRAALIGGQQHGEWTKFVWVKNPLQGGFAHDLTMGRTVCAAGDSIAGGIAA